MMGEVLKFVRNLVVRALETMGRIRLESHRLSQTLYPVCAIVIRMIATAKLVPILCYVC